MLRVKLLLFQLHARNFNLSVDMRCVISNNNETKYKIKNERCYYG